MKSFFRLTVAPTTAKAQTILSRAIILLALALLLAPPIATAQVTTPTTEIIDSTDDGTGNSLGAPRRVAADAGGNVFVAGESSNNAFKITPGGTITEIIDSTGDGAGNILDSPRGVAVDGGGNVFVTGSGSDNAFKIGGVAIPTLSGWGIFGMSTLMLGGVLYLRRRGKRGSHPMWCQDSADQERER